MSIALPPPGDDGLSVGDVRTSPLCAGSSNHYFGRPSQSAARRSCTQLCCSLETGVPPGSCGPRFVALIPNQA